MPWPLALPAVAEGSLMTAGAIGSALAAMGLIENKDAIKDGLVNFGNSVKRGTQRTIRLTSGAMSPTLSTQAGIPTEVYSAPTDAITRFNGLSIPGLDIKIGLKRKQKDTREAQGEEDTTPAPQGEDNKEPEKKPDNKPGRVRRAWQWVKDNPKKSVTAATAAFYPTREYLWSPAVKDVALPALNYGAPMLANGITGLFAGQAPFNIPIVANDSTDLWYNGGVGKVGNIAPKDTVPQVNAAPKIEIIVPSSQFKPGVNVDSLESVARGVPYVRTAQ